MKNTIPSTKATDIKQCAFCNRGIAHDRAVDFFVISIHRFVLDPASIRQQAGLEMQLGSPILANVLGPQKPIAQHVESTIDAWVCAECCYGRETLLFNAMSDGSQNDPNT